MNRAKINIFFSKNVASEVKNHIVSSSSFKETNDLGKYFGVPLIHGLVNRRTFNSLVEKMENKLSGWKAKCLSMARQITLVRSNLSSIPIYTRMTNRLPRKTCKEVERIQRNFVWRHDVNENKAHLIGGDYFCKLRKSGGMDFKKITQRIMLA